MVIIKNPGKQFEEQLYNSFPQNVFIYRIADSSSSWNSSNSQRNSRFTIKNPCDFLVYSSINRKLILLELKSCKGKSCPFSNIKIHQISKLYEYSKKDGVEAYFIFNFREVNQTFAVTVNKVHDFYKKAERKSFSLEWCRNNGILIESKLKRIKYSYDMSVLLN